MDYKNHTGIYGLLLSNQKDKLLLIRKARGPYIGLYDLPGGTPEFEENLEQTLKREILEETGLNLITSSQLITLLTVFKKENINYRHLGVIYTITAQGNLKIDADGEDSNGCLWLDIDKITAINCSPFVISLKQQGFLDN
ncbi:MAG: NUDIX domain-containing protein [Rickettsiales bacterium]